MWFLYYDFASLKYNSFEFCLFQFYFAHAIKPFSCIVQFGFTIGSNLQSYFSQVYKHFLNSVLGMREKIGFEFRRMIGPGATTTA